MIVVTTESIHGYQMERVIGQVFGVVVRSRGLGGNIMAGLQRARHVMRYKIGT